MEAKIVSERFNELLFQVLAMAICSPKYILNNFNTKVFLLPYTFFRTETSPLTQSGGVETVAGREQRQILFKTSEISLNVNESCLYSSFSVLKVYGREVFFINHHSSTKLLLKKRPPRTQLGKRLKDPFGHLIPLKRILNMLLGIISYRRLNIVNRLTVEGMEQLKELPKNKVLFVSNHQTYYADVIALYHVFCGTKWGMNNIDLPIYLLSPRVKNFYIAAEETMSSSGFLPKLFSYAGAVTVKRSWREKGKAVDRSADIRAPAKIKKALEYGWVVTFPQGTTTPNAPVRKGAASMIKHLDPLIVPVTISGFREAFGKKGLAIQKKGVQLKISFDPPIQFGKDAPVSDILTFLESHLIDKEE